jgi:hypothetical protein
MANDLTLSHSTDARQLPATERHCPGEASSAPDPRDLELEQLREAVAVWLRWNAGFEQSTQRMFEAGESPMKIEDYMDWLDQLRREAIELSRRAIG